jgi:hypothetical protein
MDKNIGNSHEPRVQSLVPSPELSSQYLQRMYSIPELIQITGMTRRQVSYWSQIGLIIPSFRNNSAKNGELSVFFSATEVVKALVVCELRRSGFSPKRVGRIADSFYAQRFEIVKNEVYLLTDGQSLYYAHSDTEVVNVLRSCRKMFVLIPLQECLNKLIEFA